MNHLGPSDVIVDFLALVGAVESYMTGSLQLFETKRHVKRVSVFISARASAEYGHLLDASSR
jgi:hypothetical protein